MGGHSRSARVPAAVWLLVALAAVLVVVATVVVLAVGRGNEAVQPPGKGGNGNETNAKGTDVMVLPVFPAGAQGPEGVVSEGDVQTALRRAADFGAVGVQVTADISWLCADGGKCRTSPLESVVAGARRLGLHVYVQANSTPQWLDSRGNWFGPTGDQVDVWAGMFAQFVEKFGTDVDGYEVWNEPNNPQFWRQGPDAGEYADLLKASWSAAKQANPKVQIIGASLSNNDLGFMHALDRELAARGGNPGNRFFYDLLGVHPYTGNATRGFDPTLPAGRQEASTPFGVKDMTFRGLERLRTQVHDDEAVWHDVFIGEFGYDTSPGWYHVPEPKRSEYFVAAFREAAAWPWVRAFVPYTGDSYAIDGLPSESSLRRAAQELRGSR